MGYPAIGKSTVAQRYIDQGYYRLNREELRCKLEDLVPKMDRLYKEGKRLFVLDNTYMTRNSRAPVIKWAKEHEIPIKCVWITSESPEAIEVAQYNAVKRMLDKFGKILTNEEIKEQKDPNIFPPVVLFSFRKKFQKPSKKEGFNKLETIQFQRNKDEKIYKNKAIILDYDGTLRKTISGEKYPKDPEDIEILPHRKNILKKYVEKGYILLGVSNQSFVSKGTLTYQEAEACFNRTNKLLGFDINYKFCPHKAFPLNCYCRKPMPGFGVEFIEKYKLDPDKTIMIGDQTTDKTFARRSGIRFIHADEFFKTESKVGKSEGNHNTERTKIASNIKTTSTRTKSIQTKLIDLPLKNNKEDESSIEDFKLILDKEIGQDLELFTIPEDTALKPFIEKQGLTFKSGSAYYELIKREEVHPAKKIIVFNKNTGEIYFNSEARNFIGISTTEKVRVSPSDETKKNYKIFIQSKSYNRKLPKDTILLYLKQNRT